MIKFTELTMRNFLSVGNITQAVRLDSVNLTLILGANNDVGATNSRNGVGKTTILQAILYGLFGEPLADFKIDSLINNVNQKGMLVTLAFERGGVSYRIERGRKPNVLRFLTRAVDGSEEDLAKGENRETQGEINRILGMTPGMFMVAFGLNTYSDPFHKMKAAEQRVIIEELLGVTTLSERAEALKDLIKGTKEGVKAQEASISALTDANGRIETAIRATEQQSLAWTTQRDTKLVALNQRVDAIGSVDFEAEVAAFDALEEWVEQERTLAAAAAAELKDAEVLARESDRLRAEAARYEREAARRATGDSQIAGMTADAARYRRDAEAGSDPQTARMEAEALRCDAEAAKGAEAQVARLNQQKDRLLAEAASLSDRGDALSDELAAVLAEIANPDAHVCSTCGQGLSGTDHFDKVKSKLEATAAKLERDLTALGAQGTKLVADADAIEVEIETTKIDHAAQQQAWRDKAAAIREEIETAKREFGARRDDWLTVAAGIERDIVTLKAHVAAQQDELRDRATALKAEADAVTAALGEKQAMAEEIASAVVLLGDRPVTAYASREAVWKLRESRDTILREIEAEKARENPHATTIASLRETLQPVSYEALNALTDELKHQDFLLKLLTGKDSFVRKRIVDRNLSFLNGRLASYLSKLGLPHDVKFLPDLSTEISLQGIDSSFPALSRGERTRVALATAWSFRDVWESMNDSVNLLFVDEMLDEGIDGAGVEAAADTLKEFAQTRGKAVFVISHRDELIARADEILMVTKRDRFTSLELQDGRP